MVSSVGEVPIGEQRPQRVAHPHLVRPARMDLPRQLGRGLRNLPNGRDWAQHGNSHVTVH